MGLAPYARKGYHLARMISACSGRRRLAGADGTRRRHAALVPQVDRAGIKGVQGLGYAAFLEAEMGLEDRREAVEFPPECRRRSNGPRRQQLADLLEDRGH